MNCQTFRTRALVAWLLASACLPLRSAGEESVSETFISYASVVNGASGGSWGLTYLSLQMVRSLAAHGTLSEVGNSTVTDATAAWTENQFNNPNGSFYLSLTSGTGAGKMVDISSTGAAAKTITLAENLTGVAQSGDQYEIRPHFTISDLFGANNSAGLEAGPNSIVADNIVLFMAESQVATTIFYSNVEGNTGW